MKYKIQLPGNIFFYILLFFFFSTANAQTLSVDSFEIDSYDTSASASKTFRTDMNDEPCGLIKVFISENNAVFNGDIVGDIVHTINQYWVYMVSGSKRLQINVSGYAPLNVDFKDYGINALKGRSTYTLVVKCPKREYPIIVLDGNNLNNHKFVDLGLSVKWATCNIGAEEPYEKGDTYAWGEIETKDYHGVGSYFDYYISPYGERVFLDYYCGGKERIVPNSGHDVAREKWGSVWRMPTIEEYKELFDSCVWTPSKKKGQQGYTVTGPNGNTIFLPLTGTDQYENPGIYWTSDLYKFQPYDWLAWCFCLNPFYYDRKDIILNKYHLIEQCGRSLGGYIRPVFDLDGNVDNKSPYEDHLKKLTGQLVIDCTPKDAVIVIDGKSYGSDQEKIELPVGNYTVEISKEGYKSVSKEIYIRARGKTDLKECLIDYQEEILYDEAIKSYNNKEYEKCVDVFVSLANKNYPEAQYMLANCYKYGFGVSQNSEYAINWYQKAAELGHLDAQYEYGEAYESEGISKMGNPEIAEKWLTIAALRGQPDAQFLLGWILGNGRNGKRDKNAAIYWLKRSADQGDERAKETLEKHYF